MENNNKSQAEIYREERKARLAKEAAKKAKRSPKHTKAVKIAKKVIAIVLAVVLVIGAVGGILNFFGTPQKLIKVSADENIKFTLAEYNYYYFLTWSNFYQTTMQYDQQYGKGMGLQATGFDSSKSPDAQSYKDDYSQMTGVTVEELGIAEPTWADAFKYAAINQLVQIKYGAMKATEAGLKVTEENKKEMDKNLEDVKKRADESDFSVDRFLRATYGNGVSEKIVRQIFTDSYLATAYFEKLQNDTKNAITADQITAEYNADTSKYNLADLRIYSFSTEAPKYDKEATQEQKDEILKNAQAATKKEADAFLNSVTDEASFVAAAKADILSKDPKSIDDADEVTSVKSATFDALKQTKEDAAKWVFDAKRVAGDKTVIEVEPGEYLVIMIVVPSYKDLRPAGNDVRHILVSFPEAKKDKDGKQIPYTAEEKKATKDKAQAILDEYLKNPTEDNFAALAKAKTEDPGSKENGGLYEGINAQSQYVAPFLNWSIDPARKTGDTGLVETEYGYHIMYYVKGTGETWYENVKESIFSNQYNDIFEKEVNARIDKINVNSAVLNWTTKSELKLIKTIIINNA